MKNSSVILGAGEIGKSLYKVLLPEYPNTFIRDVVDDINIKSAEILHVTFPYSDGFVKAVEAYREQYSPNYVVIHSTVPVGTSEKLQAIHSPIRGIHPRLEQGIKKFVKFIGGDETGDVADYFRRAGLRICMLESSRATEAMKLFDTEYYRVCIEFAHRVKKYCVENGLNYGEVYRVANQTYNEGYIAVGHPEYVRPILEPIAGVIRGHCVLPNKELIKMSEGKTE